MIANQAMVKGRFYLLKGEAIAHDGPCMRGAPVLSNGFLSQVAHLHLFLHVPQHSTVHLQPLQHVRNMISNTPSFSKLSYFMQSGWLLQPVNLALLACHELPCHQVFMHALHAPMSLSCHVLRAVPTHSLVQIGLQARLDGSSYITIQN